MERQLVRIPPRTVAPRFPDCTRTKGHGDSVIAVREPPDLTAQVASSESSCWLTVSSQTHPEAQTLRPVSNDIDDRIYSLIMPGVSSKAELRRR